MLVKMTFDTARIQDEELRRTFEELATGKIAERDFFAELFKRGRLEQGQTRSSFIRQKYFEVANAILHHASFIRIMA